jgi:thiol-disulfide isomerase/thioredoxin
MKGRSILTKRIIILSIIFAIIFGLQYFISKKSSPSTDSLNHFSDNVYFPDLPLTPLNSQPFYLSERTGVLYFINFWATWCGPCQYELPDLNALHLKYAGKGIVFLGVAFDDTDHVVNQFIKAKNIAFPIVMVSKEMPDYVFNLPGFPTTFTLDSSLRIIDVALGYQEKEYFEKMIKRAIK